MNAVLIPVIGAIVYLVGMKWYASYIDRKVVKADGKRATPAKMYADGVDFMPTSRSILFGYQFKSIAGAAPVLGPIIAIKWGWLPGLLWILLGTFFIGWVQDYTSAMISMRNDGKTFGGISFNLISPRARTILLTFIYLYLLLIAANFSYTVARTMADAHAIPLSMIVLGFAGVIVGFLIYRGRVHLAVVTVIGMALFYAALVLGAAKLPLAFGSDHTNFLIWLIFALVFSFFGSILPIWSFVQPINYLSFYIILIGMAGAGLGIIIGHPMLQRAPFTGFAAPVDHLPLWPILFVTIACGAISGWHGVVSSTGTSRQLESELDAKPVAGGAMFLEMILALIALTIVAITPLAAGAKDAAPGAVFGVGLDRLFTFLHIPAGWGMVYGPLMIVILAITILHLVVRFMRIATNELLGRVVPIMRIPSVGTFVALLLTFLLAYTGTFNYIWVMFGSANQLMASLSLMIASIWLVSERKNATFAFIPMVFMYVTTMAAIIILSKQLLQQAITRVSVSGAALAANAVVGDWVAGIIGVALFVAALILAWDGIGAFVRFWRQRKEPAPARAAGE
jgi:carbon starvation protein